jgi:hypothetical protein
LLCGVVRLPGVGQTLRENGKSLRICMKEIKIVHEARNDSEEFEQARSLWKAAQVICFLGFGYDDTTLNRLELDQTTIDRRQLFACMTKLGDARRKRVFKRFDGYAKLTLGPENQDAQEFLKQQPVLE